MNKRISRGDIAEKVALGLLAVGAGYVIGTICKSSGDPGAIPAVGGAHAAISLIHSPSKKETAKREVIELAEYFAGAAIPYIPEIYQAVENFIS